METTSKLYIDNLEVGVKVEYHVENDGIGSYEFWGAKGFDYGQDYIEIENITPIFHEETQEEREYILKMIDYNFEDYARQLEQEIDLPEEDYPDPSDYDKD